MALAGNVTMTTTNRPQLRTIPGGASGASTTTGTEAPYEFAPAFLQALVRLVCGNAEVFSKVGTLLEPKCVGHAEAKLAVEAAQAIAKDLGIGPGSPTVVVQRLVRWRSEGRITTEQINAVVEYFDAADDAGLPAPEGVISEAAAVLRRREEQKVVQRAMETYAKKGDFTAVAKAAEKAARIGTTSETLGALANEDDFADVSALGAKPKLRTGCLELDGYLGGGLPQGLTLFLGREKSGKSMVLSSLAAEAYLNNSHVLLATLELSETMQKARVLANLTNVPIDDLLAGRNSMARTRYRELQPYLGLLRMQYFSPETPATDILAWVDRCAEHAGRKVDLLVIDYIDLLGAGTKRDEGDYKGQKIVNNLVRDHTALRGYVAVSATQARRESSAKVAGKLDNSDAADSMHKVRVADLVIAMRMEADHKDLVDYYVTASRTGNDRVGTGPLPVDRSTARMFPVNRGFSW